MVKRCPTCNRISDQVKFFGEFCKFCSQDKLIGKLDKTAEILICKRCGRIRDNGVYVTKEGRSLNDILVSKFRKYVVHLISFDEEKALVHISDDSSGNVVSAEVPITLIYKKTLCETCYRKSSSYYEAVFQLRGEEKSRLNRYHDKIEKYFTARDAWIAKTDEKDNGLDVYVSDKKLADGFILDNRLERKVSYTLYGLKQGKKIYRNTYSIRL